MDKYCKVRNCYNPYIHVTRGHKCELCKEAGHGQFECRFPSLKQRLENHWYDIMKYNDKCNIANCEYRHFHKTEGHPCPNCQSVGHTLEDCLNRYKSLKCPICRTDNQIDVMQTKISGLSDECCICMDNKVEIYLKECGHVCLCSNCFLQM